MNATEQNYSSSAKEACQRFMLGQKELMLFVAAIYDFANPWKSRFSRLQPLFLTAHNILHIKDFKCSTLVPWGRRLQ